MARTNWKQRFNEMLEQNDALSTKCNRLLKDRDQQALNIIRMQDKIKELNDNTMLNSMANQSLHSELNDLKHNLNFAQSRMAIEGAIVKELRAVICDIIGKPQPSARPPLTTKQTEFMAEQDFVSFKTANTL